MTDTPDRPEVEVVLAQMEVLQDLHWRRGCDEWLRHDLSFAQLRVVMALHRDGAQPMSRVAEALGVGLPSLSALTDRLEAHGLAVRARDGIDRRVVSVSLTDAGDRLAGDVSGVHRSRARTLLAQLAPDELDGLRVALSGIARVLTAPGDGQPLARSA
ncbi:MAG TPA: MarR family transcriptional regulator [Candidatus Micrarchaeia archaeon]|nr:MarR family transcriptional regulator [Candidatus Micrarchaeia archaeon]